MRVEAYRRDGGRAFAWAWVLCLALALRSLVPMGYMPDLTGATAGGLPSLVLCAAYASAPAGPVPDGHPADYAGTHPCPFCLVTQHAGGAPLLSSAPAIAAAAMDAILVRSPVVRAPPAVRRCGAPLGSRAPPAPLV
jgi:hypothetical protein